MVKYISGSTQERGPKKSKKNKIKKNLINVLIISVKILIVQDIKFTFTENN